jgi:thiol-disulfide isomerase/thioredoxin
MYSLILTILDFDSVTVIAIPSHTTTTMATGGEAASNAEEEEHVMIHTNNEEGDIMMNESPSNISSTAVDEDQEPTYPPTKEITAADYYNPRNLTLDELEMVLYEWEEDATNIVKEYIDMRVIQSLRTGISIDDDWDDEEEEEEKEEVEGGVDNKNETKTSSWMNRLKNLASTSNTETAEDTTKTTVEFTKHGPLKYLNLTSDTAHVVEFYAPWCPHCQNYKWRYMELAAEVLRRSITPGMACIIFSYSCFFYTSFLTIS